jgi:hypothetical protein
LEIPDPDCLAVYFFFFDIGLKLLDVALITRLAEKLTLRRVVKQSKTKERTPSLSPDFSSLLCCHFYLVL